jgi:SAM-dependent methyltransferase
MMQNEHYTESYYEGLQSGVTRSAEVIVPLILQLLPLRSVVDVGCGQGGWLAVFRKLGVEDVFGVDGDYIDRDALQIPQDRFHPADLSKPVTLTRTFDLAVSLEVAEHLPAECAGVFVGSLTRLASVILFSAAIPFQGGNHHLNEEWPDKWAELFKRCGYWAVDPIRRQVWENEAVEWWYAQNTMLFVRADLLEDIPALKAEFERTDPHQLCLVHPRQYLYLQSQYRETLLREAKLRAHPAAGLKAASLILWDCIKNAVRFRLYRMFRRQAAPSGRPNPCEPGARHG